MFEFTVIAGFLVALLFLIFYANHKRRQMMEVQAVKRNGRVRSHAFYASPELLLPFASSEIGLQFWTGGKNSPPIFQATLPLKFPSELTIAIRPEDFFQKIGKCLGMQDIIIGNSSLDDAYIFKASNERHLRKFLSAELQSVLLLLQPEKPFLSLKDSVLTLRFHRYPHSAQELEDLIELVMQIFGVLEDQVAPAGNRRFSRKKMEAVGMK